MPPTVTEQLLALYDLSHWWGWVMRTLTVIVISIIVRWIAHRLVHRAFWIAFRSNHVQFGQRRARTVEGLLMGLTTLLVYLVAIIAGLSWLGIRNDNLIFAIGLFSAAFGLGARPLVSDYLAGVTLIFENLYAYGEKVEIMNVVGVVERVGLRTTELRADSGELFVVPNGDVRVIRNFSRGAFSPATVRITVAPEDLPRAIDALERFADTAVERYQGEIIDRPEIISDAGELSAKTPLLLIARAPFAHGAQLRRRLLMDVHTALREAGVEHYA